MIDNIVRSMRPRQWTKNLVILLPLVFSRELHNLPSILNGLGAFVIFCALSGSVYLFNDVQDREADRLHEHKCMRPVASGELTPRAASIAASTIALAAIGASLALGPAVALLSAGYLALQVAYTLILRNEVILDVMSIGAGFIVRVVAGAYSVGVLASPWLVACTGLLALFLGFAKRRNELFELRELALHHRPSLEHYTEPFLDSMIATVTSATIVAYTLYTVLSPSALRAPGLILSVPFVAYGLFRYLYLVYVRNLGTRPEEILLSDKPLMVGIVGWGIAVVIALYAV